MQTPRPERGGADSDPAALAFQRPAPAGGVKGLFYAKHP